MRPPTFTMLVGIPASGKSTWANNQKGVEIFSSDALRRELFGDENIQGDPNNVFSVLRDRVKKCLNEGKDAILDATNIKRANRIGFLQDLGKIPCTKRCVVFLVRFDTLLERNSKRDRVVPESVISRMFLSYQPPCFGEGWDDISFVVEEGVNDTFDMFESTVSKMDGFDQENEHHSLSLYDHCKKAQELVVDMVGSDDKVLSMATFLHDCGKLYTKTRVNAKGVEDGNCHYYNHQNAGAYLASLIAKSSLGMSDKDTVRLSNIIYHHMSPYLEWKQSEKSLKRDLKLLGEEMVSDIYVVHNADDTAH